MEHFIKKEYNSLQTYLQDEQREKNISKKTERSEGNEERKSQENKTSFINPKFPIAIETTESLEKLILDLEFIMSIFYSSAFKKP